MPRSLVPNEVIFCPIGPKSAACRSFGRLVVSRSNPNTSMPFLQTTCLIRVCRTISLHRSKTFEIRRPCPAFVSTEYHGAMGKLINRKRKEQAKTDRPANKAAVLDAARKAVLSQPPGELTLEMLDRIAGLRQGSASIFFGSLEGLVIRMLREAMSSWVDHLESTVRQGPDALSPTDLANVLVTSLYERPLLCRLLAALPAMADRRTVEMDKIVDLEKTRLERFEIAAALIESRCPDFGAGDGLLILRRAVLLAGAVEPLINRPSGLLLAMSDESLAPLYPDALEEFSILMKAILTAISAGNPHSRR